MTHSQCTLQVNLDEVMLAWNSHKIRPSANQRVPHGRPVIMYHAPAVYGVQDFMYHVDQAAIDICNEECVFRQCPCDETVYQLCELYTAEMHLPVPASAAEARLLYTTLRDCINCDLNTL